ncbi:MAG: hypothetical protein JSW64_04610 [Candidatus Zixiibacteriota bacterium]|nr:MAG: hypothetical protein JSW64_04610 [candidate division Zixibacteria bacterium]
MCFWCSLIPFTFWVTVGYFVLFSSRKSEGGMRLFGVILSIWLFIVAIGFIICGIYMTSTGQCPTDVINRVMEFLTRK